MTVPIQDACKDGDYLPPVASVPANLKAVQEGLTSIRISWSPPTPLGDTTGYRIYYSGGSNGSADVSGGSTDNFLLTGLQSRESYTLFIVATSQHFFSDIVTVVQDIPLSETLTQCFVVLDVQTCMTDAYPYPSVPAPDKPSVSVDSITSTSVSLSWTSTGSEVTSSEVMWQVFNRGGSTTKTDDDEGSGTSGSITSNSYTIENLKSGTNYSITVKVTNRAGSSTSNPITVFTYTCECCAILFSLLFFSDKWVGSKYHAFYSLWNMYIPCKSCIYFQGRGSISTRAVLSHALYK